MPWTQHTILCMIVWSDSKAPSCHLTLLQTVTSSHLGESAKPSILGSCSPHFPYLKLFLDFWSYSSVFHHLWISTQRSPCHWTSCLLSTRKSTESCSPVPVHSLFFLLSVSIVHKKWYACLLLVLDSPPMKPSGKQRWRLSLPPSVCTYTDVWHSETFLKES